MSSHVSCVKLVPSGLSVADGLLWYGVSLCNGSMRSTLSLFGYHESKNFKCADGLRIVNSSGALLKVYS